MLFLLDTNILLRLLEPSDVEYALVRNAVDTLAGRGSELCYAPQNMVEFWNVCTRPAGRNGFGLSTSETNTRAQIIEAQFRLLIESEQTHLQWRRLVVAHSVTGAQVHDARLAAAAMTNGVGRILSLNDRDFSRYSGISAVHPRSVLATA